MFDPNSKQVSIHIVTCLDVVWREAGVHLNDHIGSGSYIM